jgi:ABC-type uncharacterized transport system ATPase subunit
LKQKKENALYGEFTLNETLSYFGFLHDMDKSAREKRKQFLLEFLDMKEFSKNLVKSLRYFEFSFTHIYLATSPE